MSDSDMAAGIFATIVHCGMPDACIAIKETAQHLVQSLSASDVRDLLRRGSCRARLNTSDLGVADCGRAAVPLESSLSHKTNMSSIRTCRSILSVLELLANAALVLRTHRSVS